MALSLLSTFSFSESTDLSSAQPAVDTKPMLSAKVVDDGESGFGFESFEKTLSAKVSVLNCGQTKVVITTTCGEGGDEVYCPNQNVAFITKIEQENYRQIHYDHPFRGGDAPFIAGALCFQYKKKYYVRLDSTNYGNCIGCEWQDAFTDQGQYVWSTRGYKGTTSFKRKLITGKFFGQLMEQSDGVAQANGAARISISRWPDESKNGETP